MLKSMSNTLCSVKIRKHLWFHLSQAYSDLLDQRILRDNNDKKLENEELTAANENKEKYVEEPNIKTVTSHSDKNEPSQLKKSSPKVKTQFQRKFNITPKKVWKKVPQTVLAFHIGPNVISWAYVNSTFEVLDWNWTYWCGERQPTAKTYELINTISDLIEMLPTADTYVMEDSKILPKTKDLKKLLVQQYLSTSIMSCIQLRNRLLSPSSNNVYILDLNTAARWFDLVVGSEVVSTEHIMTLLLEENKNYNEVSISVNEEIKHKHRELQKGEKEQINWSLLKAISFLCITKKMVGKEVQRKQ